MATTPPLPDDEPDEQDETAAVAPCDNLIRALTTKGTEWRAAEDAPLGELYGQFAQYRNWYEVDSLWEGRFMERIMPGAFTDTIANDQRSMRVLLNHGMDSFGQLPIAALRSLEDRDDGPYYEAPLYDTAFNRDNVLPILQGKLMNGTTAGQSGFGASMRFQVQDDKWDRRAKADKYNPEALPERSITRAKVFEFGPVTFPANEGATASARSMSDEWLGHLIGDERFQREFSDRVGAKVASRILAAVPEDLRDAVRAKSTTPTTTVRLSVLRRRARVILATS